MTRVHELIPGDLVHLAGESATFVATTAHPLYVYLELVVWRMADGSWSHDALLAVQDVGEVDPVEPYQRVQRLRAALLGGAS